MAERDIDRVARISGQINRLLGPVTVCARRGVLIHKRERGSVCGGRGGDIDSEMVGRIALCHCKPKRE